MWHQVWCWFTAPAGMTDVASDVELVDCTIWAIRALTTEELFEDSLNTSGTLYTMPL